jgi:hypothetical protein
MFATPDNVGVLGELILVKNSLVISTPKLSLWREKNKAIKKTVFDFISENRGTTPVVPLSKVKD